MKIKNSIQLKIAAMFTAVTLLGGIMLGTVVYKTSEKLILTSLGKQAEKVATMAEKKVDPEKFKEIRDEVIKNLGNEKEIEKIVQSKDFRKMNKVLDDYRINQGLQYVYTFIKKDGKYLYIVDGYDINGEGDDGISYPGDEDSSLYQSTKVYETKKIVVGNLEDTEDWGPLLSTFVPIKDKNGEVLGILGADLKGKEIYEQLVQAKKTIFINTSIFVLISIFISIFFTRRLTRPLKELVSNIKEMEKGNLTVEFKSYSKDEIGELAFSSQKTVKQLSNMIKEINNSSYQLETTSDELMILAKNTTLEANKRVEQTEKMNETTIKQLEKTEEAVNSIQKMNKEIEEMDKKMIEVNEKSEKVNQSAEVGKIQIEKTKEKMDYVREIQKEYSNVVYELEEKTKKISTIITTIAKISKHTNLLALNASIEAARAGEKGKGFAVVATEIRKLADETNNAVGNISELVNEIQKSMNHSVEEMEETTENILDSSKEMMTARDSFMTIIDEIKEVNSHIKEMKTKTNILTKESELTKKIAKELEEYGSLSLESVISFRESIQQQEKITKQVENETEKISKMSKILTELVKVFKTKK